MELGRRGRLTVGGVGWEPGTTDADIGALIGVVGVGAVTRDPEGSVGWAEPPSGVFSTCVFSRVISPDSAGIEWVVEIGTGSNGCSAGGEDNGGATSSVGESWASETGECKMYVACGIVCEDMGEGAVCSRDRGMGSTSEPGSGDSRTGDRSGGCVEQFGATGEVARDGKGDRLMRKGGGDWGSSSEGVVAGAGCPDVAVEMREAC